MASNELSDDLIDFLSKSGSNGSDSKSRINALNYLGKGPLNIGLPGGGDINVGAGPAPAAGVNIGAGVGANFGGGGGKGGLGDLGSEVFGSEGTVQGSRIGGET